MSLSDSQSVALESARSDACSSIGFISCITPVNEVRPVSKVSESSFTSSQSLPIITLTQSSGTTSSLISSSTLPPSFQSPSNLKSLEQSTACKSSTSLPAESIVTFKPVTSQQFPQPISSKGNIMTSLRADSAHPSDCAQNGNESEGSHLHASAEHIGDGCSSRVARELSADHLQSTALFRPSLCGADVDPAQSRNDPNARSCQTLSLDSLPPSGLFPPEPSTSTKPFSIPQSQSFHSFPVCDSSLHMPCHSSQLHNHATIKPENFDLPDLDNLVLALSREVDFDSFFLSLINILDRVFQCSRASISIPNDPTAIIAVPWALKAVWNKHVHLGSSVPSGYGFWPPLTSTSLAEQTPPEGDSSLGELPGPTSSESAQKNNSSNILFQSPEYSTCWTDDEGGDSFNLYQQSNPVINHSPTSSELQFQVTKSDSVKSRNKKLCSNADLSREVDSFDPSVKNDQSSLRQRIFGQRLKKSRQAKKKTKLPGSTAQIKNDEGSDEFSQHLDHETGFQELESPLAPSKHMLVFSKFRSLDYEPDPIIDAQGVVRVLERGQFVQLQRKYYKSPFDVKIHDQSDSPFFCDLEQAIDSPWCESPLPSPLIKELKESYFSYSQPDQENVDKGEMEAAFAASDLEDETKSESNESSTPKMPVHAIGCENTTSIIHIPLIIPARRISIADAAQNDASNHFSDTTASPIAILSVMSPLIPYPQIMRDLLKRLSSHIAIAYLKASLHENMMAQLETSAQFQRQTRRFSTSISTSPITASRLSIKHNRSKKIFRRLSLRRPNRVKSKAKALLKSNGSSFLANSSPDPQPKTSTSSNELSASSSGYYHWHRSTQGYERIVPSSSLLRTIIDAIPIQVFTLEPISGYVTWVSNRTLAYRGQTAEEFFQNPYASIHSEDREEFKESLTEALQKGEPLGSLVRLRRFDGRYRITSTRVVPLRDNKGGITHWLCSIMDVHKQQKAEEEALMRARDTASDHKYKILADATPIIVFTVHPVKGVIYANNKWFSYSGCSKENTFGFQYLKRIHPDDRARCLQLLSPDPNEPPLINVEARLLNKNDEYNWHLISYTSIDIDGKKDDSMLYFGTCTNIQNQKLIQQNLQEAKDVAQKIMESKTRFLSNMSHEIRTPLIGISGMVSFLMNTNLTEEQLDYCHTISSSSDALLTVINDILDLSKVEAGKMTLDPTWFHVRLLVEEANEFLSSMALAKSLELNYVVESDVPVWVKGDRIRLRQVMLNIIGNAIKYTDKGEVFTRCSVSQASDSTKGEPSIILKFEVIDTGRGFTTEDEAIMFQPFSQLKVGSNETRTVGTGLGLMISRQLIKLHGGRLTCTSEKGVGSSFVFTCNVQLPSEEDGPSLDELNEAAKSSFNETAPVIRLDLDILIICPYKYSAESILHHIRKTVVDPSKCRYTVAKDANALETLDHNWTHVIINVIDIDDAVVVVNRVLEMNKTKQRDIEVVMLSTPLQRQQIMEGIHDDYRSWAKVTILYKPLKPSRYSLVFDPSKVREESLDMKMQNAHQVLESQKDIFKTIQTFASSKDYRILLAEDNVTNQKVMDRFFAKSGLHCDIAVDGEDCVLKVFAEGPGHYDLLLVSCSMH